ncbi:HEPN domain-containing protein [Terasakiella brassicae]|uniref:HEPN domain-containing protein n=1 Tax=Terasakiella brassicae TaxID=1634917 RepID=UPI00166563E2|nr:HEPN domain-containing protein [Terasakiella brassicae]
MSLIDRMLFPAPTGGSYSAPKSVRERLYALAEKSLQNTPKLKGKMTINEFAEYLRPEIARIIYNKAIPDKDTVTKLLQRVRKKAVNDLKTLTHYFPCSLASDSRQMEFSIGPVTFTSQKKWQEFISSEKHDNKDKYFDEARKYYSKFKWIASVDIEECSAQISEERAKKALEISLEALSAVFSSQGSEGLSFQNLIHSPIKTHRLIKEKGKEFNASTQISWKGHHLSENWFSEITQHGFNLYLQAVGDIVSEQVKNNVTDLMRRYIDALHWYGEGIREKDAGVKIIKLTSAIETLVFTKPHDSAKTRTFKERSSSLIAFKNPQEYRNLKKKFNQMYDARSGVIHGRIKYGTIKWATAHEYEGLCRSVLFQAIQYYQSIGFNTAENLEDEFNFLVETVSKAAA